MIFFNFQFDARVKMVVSPFTGSREYSKKLFFFALMSQTHEKKLYAKILLKKIENHNDNFKMVAIECSQSP